ARPAIAGTSKGGWGQTTAEMAGTLVTVAGHRCAPTADRQRGRTCDQDTIWSRSAPAARLLPGDTCDNAFGEFAFATRTGTDRDMAARATPQGRRERRRWTEGRRDGRGAGRRRRQGVCEDGRGRARCCFGAGRTAGGGPRALRPPLRGPGHRGQSHRSA